MRFDCRIVREVYTSLQIVDKSLYLSRKDIGFLLYIGNFRNEIVFFCIF